MLVKVVGFSCSHTGLACSYLALCQVMNPITTRVKFSLNLLRLGSLLSRSIIEESIHADSLPELHICM